MAKNKNGKELGRWLTQRKDGRYEVKIPLPDGKRIGKTFKADEEQLAMEWRDERAYEIGHGIQCHKDMKLDAWYEQWITNREDGGCEKTTIATYKRIYTHYISPLLGRKMLTDIRRIDCQNALNKMRGKHKSSTIKTVKSVLSNILNEAVQNDYIVKNPASKMKISATQKDEEQVRAKMISDEQIQTFFDYAKGCKYYALFQVAIHTGMRYGELCGLKWEDIDFVKKEIVVRRALKLNTTNSQFYLGNTKTQNSNRIIPVKDNVLQILKQHRKSQLEIQLSAGSEWNKNTEFNNLVFTTSKGAPVHRHALHYAITGIERKIYKSVGINPELQPHISMHSFRHIYATKCAESGMTPQALQKIMGHSNIGITNSYYIHVTNQYLHNELEKVFIM